MVATPDVLRSPDRLDTPETPIYKSMPVLQARLAVGKEAFNPDQPVARIEKSKLAIDWSPLIKASNNTRQEHWKGVEYNEQVKQFTEKLVDEIADKNRQTFFKSAKGERIARAYATVGLNVHACDEAAVDNFLSVNFDNGKSSNINIFAYEMAKFYEDVTTLQEDALWIEALAGAFGKMEAKATVQATELLIRMRTGGDQVKDEILRELEQAPNPDERELLTHIWEIIKEEYSSTTPNIPPIIPVAPVRPDAFVVNQPDNTPDANGSSGNGSLSTPYVLPARPATSSAVIAANPSPVNPNGGSEPTTVATSSPDAFSGHEDGEMQKTLNEALREVMAKFEQKVEDFPDNYRHRNNSEWQRVVFGPALKTSHGSPVGGSLQVKIENMPKALELLTKLGLERESLGKTLEFAWLRMKVPQHIEDGGESERDNYVNDPFNIGEYSELRTYQPRLTLLGDSREDIDEIFGQLYDYPWMFGYEADTKQTVLSKPNDSGSQVGQSVQIESHQQQDASDFTPITDSDAVIEQMRKKLGNATDAVKFQLSQQAFVNMIKSLHLSRLGKITVLHQEPEQRDPNRLVLSGSLSAFKTHADFTIALKNQIDKSGLSVEMRRFHQRRWIGGAVKDQMKDRLLALDNEVKAKMGEALPAGWHVTSTVLERGMVYVALEQVPPKGSDHHRHKWWKRKTSSGEKSIEDIENVHIPGNQGESFMYQRSSTPVRLQRITQEPAINALSVSGAQAERGQNAEQDTIPTTKKEWEEKARELASAVRNQGFGMARGVFPQTIVSGADGNTRPEVGMDALGFSHGENVDSGRNTELRKMVGIFSSIPWLRESTNKDRQVWIISPYDRVTRDVWERRSSLLRRSQVRDVKTEVKNEFNGKHGESDWIRYDYFMPVRTNQESRDDERFINVSLAVPPHVAEQINTMVDNNPNFPDMLFRAIYPGKVGPDPDTSISRLPATELQVLDLRENPDDRDGVIRQYETPIED